MTWAGLEESPEMGSKAFIENNFYNYIKLHHLAHVVKDSIRFLIPWTIGENLATNTIISCKD